MGSVLSRARASTGLIRQGSDSPSRRLLSGLKISPPHQVTLGIEGNLAARAGWAEWRLMPQVHIQVNHHFRLQWGIGAVGFNGAPYAAGAFRGIVEL